MQTFTQKWSIVSFIEPVINEAEFFWKDWPLHVTIMNTFAVNWQQDDLFEKLEALIASHKPVPVTAVEQVTWGKHSVMLLTASDQITHLHMDLYHLLVSHGAEFNELQYVGSGYLPHSTIQKTGRLHIGDQVVLKSVAIVDMFPRGDAYQRKIHKTFPLSK